MNAAVADVAQNDGYWPLPITVEEITRDWLTHALRRGAPGVTVLGMEIVDVVYATCSKVRLHLDLDEAGRRAGIPDRLILKGGFEAHSREWAQMHEREVRGYRDVYPKVPLPSPRCFFADYDPLRRQGIVIMEDLLTLGVTFCHAQSPQSYPQMARRLSELAKFHAATWATTRSDPFAEGSEWHDLTDFFGVMEPFFEAFVAPEIWEECTRLPRGAAVSVDFLSREWMIGAFRRMTRLAASQPHCVLHGDVHLGNLYEYPDGTPGFLDTLASHGPGMMEVSYFVSASIDSARRREWERPLVAHYLSELGRCGVVDLPALDEAMRQYGIYLVYGHFIWICNRSHYQPEAVNTANAARVSAAMIDHEIDRLLAGTTP